MTENEHEARMARPRMAAGALFFDDDGRILLVEPTYKDHREIPGGYVETGESPRQACVREVAEELGIQPDVGPLLVMDWAPNPGEGDKILYVFDGGILAPTYQASIRLQAAELRSYAFHDIEAVDDLTVPRLARRIRAAVEARRTGRTDYLEQGTRV